MLHEAQRRQRVCNSTRDPLGERHANVTRCNRRYSGRSGAKESHMSRLFSCGALVITIAVLAQPAPRAQQPAAPTIDELISLKRAGSPAISPDGRLVAYTVRETNWEDNT